MECLAEGKRRGVEIISPAQTPRGKLQGKLTLEDFDLDDEGRILRCPAGQEPVETSIADARLQVLFDVSRVQRVSAPGKLSGICRVKSQSKTISILTRASQAAQTTLKRDRRRIP